MIGVILAGGSGTRFWPMSRELHPKQLQKITGSKTLIQLTVERLTPLISESDQFVVTHEQHAFETCSQLSETGLAPFHLLAEPVGKNTAAAIALAAFFLDGQGRSEEVMAVFPADHLIQNKEAFHKALREGESIAQQDYLVTLGASPTRAETGFGYISKGVSLGSNTSACQVKEFIEKPDLETATRFFNEGGYYWNCGIFMWKVSTFLESLKQFLPETYAHLSSITAHLIQQNGPYGFQALNSEGTECYEKLKSISIDYGVMEKADRVAVIPCSMGWSDIGSWDALDAVLEKDDRGNVLADNVYTLDCDGNIIQGNHRLIATVGIENLIIVDTSDALLVCSKDRAQDVKKLVEMIREHKREEARQHTTVQKPWGSYTVLATDEDFLVKRIVVLPGQKLSLQSHQHREEHWVVTSGQAEVERDGEIKLLNQNESIHIPKKCKHRLGNPGTAPLHLIETQLGKVHDESDIIRYQDLYGRDSSS